MIKQLEDLDVFKVSYELSMEIYSLSRTFPKYERYSLTDQILKSSRSIAANIAEGWAQRRYEKVFIRFLFIAYGSCEETKVWLQYTMDCKYLEKEKVDQLLKRYDALGAKLYMFIKRVMTN